MREFEQPSADFQIAVDEALFFSNSDRVQNDLLRDGNDRLVGSLKSAATPELAAAELWRVICSREPAAEEIEVVRGWFAKTSERRVNDMQALIWALLAGPEFRFNH
jgi:hypothetical protein